MKKIILLAAVLITVIGLNVWAEKEVLIYQGEYITSTPMSNIDSIGFIHNEIFHNEEDWSETNLLFYKGCHKSNIGRVDYIDSVVFTSDIPPVIQAFYCEFVPAGEVLRVAGKNFFNPSVYFYGENGDLIKASKVETKGSTELFITVPEGATHSKPIVVETAYGKTESKILFRDRRNIFIDFDNLLPTVSGTMEPGGTGGANPKPKWKESLLDLLPAGFELPKGCDGLYDQVNLINFDEGGYISYYTELGGRTPQIPLYGNFGNMSVEDLVLKFEVYTPNQYAINGIYADVTFPPKGNNGMRTSGRELTGMRDESCVPGTWWCPFEGNIDKLDPNDWIWQIGLNAKEYFYTDWSEFSYSGNWMTVSIPLSSFIWNIMDRGIQTDMENNFGINSVSCTAYNKELVVGDWTKAMGDFTFMWEPWAYSGQVGRFLCFLDNFRIVPDDGNGVQYGKLGQRAYTGDIFTGGRPYPQNSSALVEYNSSIVTVSGFDNDGNETPLTADAEVTIFGERLDLVEKIVFSNGVETFPVRQSANQLTLTFPKEAFDGTLEFGLLPDRIVWGLQMSLVVSPKTEGEETVHIPTPVIVFDQDLQSEKALEELTKTLYGGQIWQNYMDKFDWCAHESMAGNLYQTFGQESLFFQLNLSANNDIIKMGYEGLYTVISRANFIINNVQSLFENSNFSEEKINTVIAEAKMFRGMAYFLLTELWGEVPIILQDDGQNGCLYCNRSYSEVLSNRPKANRASLYTLIEMDWLYAAKYLPINPANSWRATRFSAKGMLSKLYLTMASCQTPGLASPYVCLNPTEYYQKAIYMATDVIQNSGKILEPYANIFDLNKQFSSNESLFALQFYDTGYEGGSHYQSQMGMNQFWAPNSGWGATKSLTWSLYESYSAADNRKKEVCIYANQTYSNYKGEVAPPYGVWELLSSPTLNNIKKYVYGYSSNQHIMSTPARRDFLRLADVYLIRAEAKMALENLDASTPTSAGIADLNAVLNAHAGMPYSGESIAFYTPVPKTRELVYHYQGNDGGGWQLDATVSMMVYEPRTDFIQERRKEFAMESQNWLDIKRLYYRNPQYAKDFLKEQDRGWNMEQKWNALEQGVNVEIETGYIRRELLNKLFTGYPSLYGQPYPEISLNPDLVSGNFNTWFLPVPANIIAPSGSGLDFTEQIINGTYKD